MDEFKKLIEEIKECIDKLEKLAAGDRIKEMQVVAARLKFYRSKNKLTQDALAQKLGVNKMAIIRWEAAKVMPSKLSIMRFKEVGIL